MDPRSGLALDLYDPRPSSLFPASTHWETGGSSHSQLSRDGRISGWGRRQPATYLFQEDTISINHNWVNGCNLANMWHFLQQELHTVQREVSEWRDTMPDWHHHCQVRHLA